MTKYRPYHQNNVQLDIRMCLINWQQNVLQLFTINIMLEKAGYRNMYQTVGSCLCTNESIQFDNLNVK